MTTIYEKLLAYEIDGSNPADGRRVIRDERMTVQSRTAELARLRNAKRVTADEIAAAADSLAEAEREAKRVLAMWVDR